MIIRTLKLSDKNVVDLIKRLASHVPKFVATGTYADGIQFSVSNLDDLRTLPSKANERLIEKFSFGLAKQTSDQVLFARGVTSKTQHDHNQPEMYKFKRRDVDPYFDELGMFENPSAAQIANYQRFDDDTKLAVAREIGRLAAPVSEVSDDTASRFGQVLDQNIADIQRVSIDFLDASRAARLADEASLQKRLEDLESTFSQRAADLEQQRKDLEVRREELNDREPQHERRKLREDLTKRLHETISAPARTSAQREWQTNFYYLGTAAALLILSLFITVGSELQIGRNTTSAAFWTLSLKSLALGIAGAAFAWAGLSGMKVASKAAREYEQAVQRYAFDMDRASWVVETLLQMNSIESAQVPTEWLEAVCRDLFLHGANESEEPRSLDALAALLDATAKAKVGSNGFEFEINRREARQLAAEAR